MTLDEIWRRVSELAAATGLIALSIACTLDRNRSVVPSDSPGISDPNSEEAPGLGPLSAEGHEDSGDEQAYASPPGTVPPIVHVPIFMSDVDASPAEVRLWLGQEVVLDLFNVGSVTHEFAIGRDLVIQNGVPTEFGQDFFQNGALLDSVLWASEIRPKEDGEGFAITLPPRDGQFFFQRQTQLMVDTGMDMYGYASLEFQVTREMLGEWQFASFGQSGDLYVKGVRGRLVVVAPFALP